MKPSKGEPIPELGPLVRVELELEKTIVDKILLMEGHTRISRMELVTTALKRFISAHKDYFPADYKDSSKEPDLS